MKFQAPPLRYERSKSVVDIGCRRWPWLCLLHTALPKLKPEETIINTTPQLCLAHLSGQSAKTADTKGYGPFSNHAAPRTATPGLQAALH